MATETETNIRVWARRFNVEIHRMERAVEYADRAYGAPTRRGPILVVAMKAIALKNPGRAFTMGAAQNVIAASMVAQMVYQACYSGESGHLPTLAQDILEQACAKRGMSGVRADIETIVDQLVEMAADVIAVRNRERSSPSLANIIIDQARRG